MLDDDRKHVTKAKRQMTKKMIDCHITYNTSCRICGHPFSDARGLWQGLRIGLDELGARLDAPLRKFCWTGQRRAEIADPASGFVSGRVRLISELGELLAPVRWNDGRQCRRCAAEAWNDVSGWTEDIAGDVATSECEVG